MYDNQSGKFLEKYGFLGSAFRDSNFLSFGWPRNLHFNEFPHNQSLLIGMTGRKLPEKHYAVQ